MTETTHEALVRQAAAAEELLAYFQGQRDQFQADVAQAQAGYVALGENLVSIVSDQMYFAATIDPDAVNPTEVRGGTFNTIADAVNASPAGATVALYLLSDKTFPLTSEIFLQGREVIVVKSGGGANPVIAPTAIANGTVNLVHGFNPANGGAVRLSNVDVTMPAKVDAGLGWDSSSRLMKYASAARSFLGVTGGTLTAEAGQAIISAHVGTFASLSLRSVTLDGAFNAMSTLSEGVGVVAVSNVTLLNGADISDGAVGVNVLHN